LTWRRRGTPPSPTCCPLSASHSAFCSAGSTRACTRRRPAGTSPEQAELTRYGLGITNIAPRATAQAAELTPAELRDGAARLLDLVAARRPRVIAIAGVTAYRTAFGLPKAVIGPQPEPLGTARLWILPNPSGLNAHTSIPLLAAELRRLRERLEE
jgi:TDG/mug DNA glycosylase family protein